MTLTAPYVMKGGERMKHWKIGLMLVFSAVLLAACAQATPLTPTAVLVTATKAIQSTPVPTPTLAATATPEKKVDNCVECHTNKESLIKNAKPVVEKPKESEGTG